MNPNNAGETILVVDDMPQNVTLMRVILKNAGYRVIEATNGLDALAMLKQEKPDAIILDVRMPGMTGYEVCKKIRSDSRFATLPVIMVTALSGTAERIKGIEAGATDFITKPFDKKELLARVKASLVAAATMPAPRGVMGQLTGGIIVTDPQWTVLEINDSAARLLDQESEQLLGQKLLPLLQHDFSIPANAGDENNAETWEFRQQASEEKARCVAGKHTAVTDANGRVTMHVLVLNPCEPA